VDARKVRQIREVHRELHDVVERSSAGFGDGLQVGEDAVYLLLDAFDELTARGIEPDLPGEVERVAAHNGLRGGADRSRRFRCGYDSSSHRVRRGAAGERL